MANEVWGGGVIGNIKLDKVMIDMAGSIIVPHWELGLCQEDIINCSGVGRTIRRAQGEDGGQRNGSQEGRGYLQLNTVIFHWKHDERRLTTSCILLQLVDLPFLVEGVGGNLSGEAEFMGDRH